LKFKPRSRSSRGFSSSVTGSTWRPSPRDQTIICFTFLPAAYKRENIHRKPAEECYDYIKKKLGGLTTQRAFTANPDFHVETIYRGGYIGSTHNRAKKLLLELSKLLSRKYESHTGAHNQYYASYHEEEKTRAPKSYSTKNPLRRPMERTHPRRLP